MCKSSIIVILWETVILRIVISMVRTNMYCTGPTARTLPLCTLLHILLRSTLNRLLLHQLIDEQLARHGNRNPLLHLVSFLLHPPCIRNQKWYRRLWYLLVPGALLSIMSRLTFVSLPQLHHIPRRRRHVHVHGYGYGHAYDGGNERPVLCYQHPMATNDGILHSTKL